MGINRRAMAEVEDLAALVIVRLTTLQTCPGKKDLSGLRDVLQQFVDRVMDLAHSTEQQ